MTFVPMTIDDLHPVDVRLAAESTAHLAPAEPGSCREVFRVLIAEILRMADACGMNEHHLRLELRAAWVWGPRDENRRAYLIWRDEIALQRGRLRGRLRASPHMRRQRDAESSGQCVLFPKVS